MSSAIAVITSLLAITVFFHITHRRSHRRQARQRLSIRLMRYVLEK
jgi:hypothetical protein